MASSAKNRSSIAGQSQSFQTSVHDVFMFSSHQCCSGLLTGLQKCLFLFHHSLMMFYFYVVNVCERTLVSMQKRKFRAAELERV